MQRTNRNNSIYHLCMYHASDTVVGMIHTLFYSSLNFIGYYWLPKLLKEANNLSKEYS